MSIIPYNEAPTPGIGKPPTDELGRPSLYAGPVLPGMPSWQMLIGDELERVPALQWPMSIETYNSMRSDSQIQGLLLGSFMPIQRYTWTLDANGCQPAKVKLLAADLGLDIKGQDTQPRRRHKRRFSFSEHLRLALLALVYGHYPFEQVGEVVDGVWRLRKLAQRPPHTINQINVDYNGSLRFIRQLVGPEVPPIPIERMVWYVWGMEGANWTGRSMMRSCYRNWLIKDRTLRVGAINIERAGAGTPVVEAPPDASDRAMEALADLARKFRAGEHAGGAIPNGSKLTLQGIQGSQPDAGGYIRLQNEEMARAFLMMFFQLGQTETGSRALGAEFIDWFGLAQETIANWFADIFTEHVIEDWWDWNVGEDEEKTPILAYQRDDQPNAAITDLVALINANAIIVDSEVEGWIRERLDMPEKPPDQPAPADVPPPPAALPPGQPPPNPAQAPAPTPAPAPPVAAAVGPGALIGSPTVMLPARSLRRQPYDHEVRAATDFAQLESEWSTAMNSLTTEYRMIQQRRIPELHEAIISAKNNLKKLANLKLDPISQDVIGSRLAMMSEAGANQAMGEAARQGVQGVKSADVDKLRARAFTRGEAVDTYLTRSFVQSASRRALRGAGGGMNAEEVAADVTGYLQSLSSTYLQDQLGGALTGSMNDGRVAVMRENEPQDIYASELLDANTCENCVAKDGEVYASADEATADYPTGGYIDCLGQERCRGTLVAVYGEF